MGGANWSDHPLEFGPYGAAEWLEYRAERPYDEQGVSHIICPNGSLAATQHRGLAVAMERANIAWYLHDGAAA